MTLTQIKGQISRSGQLGNNSLPMLTSAGRRANNLGVWDAALIGVTGKVNKAAACNRLGTKLVIVKIAFDVQAASPGV